LITPRWHFVPLFPENPMVAMRQGQAVEKHYVRGREAQISTQKQRPGAPKAAT
jgi:hypothetical protein